MSETDALTARFMAAVRQEVAAVPRGANQVCALCTQLLPVDRAAVMACTGEQVWEMLGASDDIAAGFAQVQVVACEGPGPQAYLTDAPVLVPDLGAALAAGRWPLLAAAGSGERSGAVFSFPLRRGAIRVGTLDFYTTAPTALDAHGFAAAVHVADLVTVLLLTSVREDSPESATGVETYESNGRGLGPWWTVAESTREIHQATGMVAAQLQVDLATAHAQLVARALSAGQPIAKFAADIVTRRIRFAPNESGDRDWLGS
ncbi:hypothetical protein DFR70_1011049 [Nocardia tenerifensis]|uniref:ANTAR domain-containing protein n=1 Tax=Nocardia tenerifensis TaxID=228006 RepID=A0A318KF81_9NOCA|nr:ANTAR domain-containing protein [Nocardia tenerifensis]PXX71615.1 hypothetical protein DFR70_1011049 [Nocardia tenerifensis]